LPAGLGIACATSVLAACGGSPITAARLNAAIGPTFTHLYAEQQRLIGNPVDPGVYTTSSCERTGGVVTGAGDDWVCAVIVYRRTGLPISANLEVRVRTNGCYEADSPLAAVGPPQLTAPDGSSNANPLTEFDGCFDTS
jgi:hypothetical protein